MLFAYLEICILPLDVVPLPSEHPNLTLLGSVFRTASSAVQATTKTNCCCATDATRATTCTASSPKLKMSQMVTGELLPPLKFSTEGLNVFSTQVLLRVPEQGDWRAELHRLWKEGCWKEPSVVRYLSKGLPPGVLNTCPCQGKLLIMNKNSNCRHDFLN